MRSGNINLRETPDKPSKASEARNTQSRSKLSPNFRIRAEALFSKKRRGDSYPIQTVAQEWGSQEADSSSDKNVIKAPTAAPLSSTDSDLSSETKSSPDSFSPSYSKVPQLRMPFNNSDKHDKDFKKPQLEHAPHAASTSAPS